MQFHIEIIRHITFSFLNGSILIFYIALLYLHLIMQFYVNLCKTVSTLISMIVIFDMESYNLVLIFKTRHCIHFYAEIGFCKVYACKTIDMVQYSTWMSRSLL